MAWQTDLYATHQPLLFWAVNQTTGPVLELGMGSYSTPILHLLCSDRVLVSLEGNPRYFEAFQGLQTDNHRLLFVPNWDECKLLDMEWDVAFVSHAPAAARKSAVLRLKGRCKYLVCHDTECSLYGYESAFEQFKYRVDCKWQNKWASVLSMTEPLDDIEQLLELNEPQEEEPEEPEQEVEYAEEVEVEVEDFEEQG